MKPFRVFMPLIFLASLGCVFNGQLGRIAQGKTITINTLDDAMSPDFETMSLRKALFTARSGDKLIFDKNLNGKIILLTSVGEEHSILKGEVYDGGPFAGYQDRDYGRSALYVKKSITIDASELPLGITVKWAGGDEEPARVMAVFGDLTMKNVTVSSGYSKAEEIAGGTQPYTLARGGGLAVWGIAALINCKIINNRIEGDINGSRDRGAYGGGIYADGLDLKDCIISGNTAKGYGAAGGGIYSVGGGANTEGIGNNTVIERCVISGNRVTAQHAYGGGIFTLSGGPYNLATMRLTNCTIAQNLVEDNPELPDAGQYYYRGGGIYMGGGSLFIKSCTIAENEIKGVSAVFSGKPNIGGGGVGATIGNAHVIESMKIQHSIVCGNKMNDATEDLFSGSLVHFYSYGYNLFGLIDFTYMLVPVPDWMDLCRKHYPKDGDKDGIVFGDIVSDKICHGSILSEGIDKGDPAVLYYMPAGEALDKLPSANYYTNYVLAGYTGFGVGTDDFLNYLILQVRDQYSPGVLEADFGDHYGDMTGVTWYGPANTWPTDPLNADWITFWRALDAEFGGRLGAVKLGDDFWGSFESGPLGSNVTITVGSSNQYVSLPDTDQNGLNRPIGTAGDIGAIEKD